MTLQCIDFKFFAKIKKPKISAQNDTYKYRVTIINGIGHVLQEIYIREIKLYFAASLGR